MIALSTLWNSTKVEDGQEILSRIRDMGFEAIELDYHLTGTMLDEMRPLLGRDIQVVSIHNFCPIPPVLPKEMAGSDVFSLSSADKEERQRAIEYTIATIELADSIDSRTVVCHLGYVDVKDPTKKLIELYNKGEKESHDFVSLLEKAKDQRAAEQQRNLDAALFSLDRLIRRAESLEIFIGMENRRELRQIPDFDEIGIILNEFGGANLAYWHNTGYAQIQSNLGITDHTAFLEAYSDGMIGVHLQDTKAGADCLAPGVGEVDFRMVCEHLPQDVVKVMQLTPDTTRDRIAEALSYLEDLGF